MSDDSPTDDFAEDFNDLGPGIRDAPVMSAASSYVELVNDPSVVVYRRAVTSQAPLSWVAHNIFQVLGYRSETILESEFGAQPDVWLSLIHRESVPQYREFIRDLMETDRAGCLYRLLAADGNYRYVRDEARVVRSDDGEAIDIVGCLLDWSGITEIDTSTFSDIGGSGITDATVSRQYRLREMELIADLLCAHCYIRKQSRAYRDAVQTLAQITDRLRASASESGAGVISEDLFSGLEGGATHRGELLPIGIYRAEPTASRALLQGNVEFGRLVALDQHGFDLEHPQGFHLSRITTPDIAQTNEDTVDVAIRSREDFDLVYPVVEQAPYENGADSDTDTGASKAEPQWVRWIWEQGRIHYDGDQPVAIYGVISDVTESMASEVRTGDGVFQSEIDFVNRRAAGGWAGSSGGVDMLEANDEFAGDATTIFSDTAFNMEGFKTNAFTEDAFDESRSPLLGADDEIVAVFNATDVLDLESPTVELIGREPKETEAPTEEDVAAQKAKIKRLLSDMPLSVSGAEIASWDHETAAVPDASDNGDLLDFEFEQTDGEVQFGSDAAWEIESTSLPSEALFDLDPVESGIATGDFAEDELLSFESSVPGGSEIEEHLIDLAASTGTVVVPVPESADEFEDYRLYAQPAYAVQSLYRPVYVELLLRQYQGDAEPLIPADFKLHSQDRETQVRIDHWVVKHALDQLVSGIDGASEIGIAINLSSHAIKDVGFSSYVQACIDATAVNPARVSFELPDINRSGGVSAVSDFINDIKKFGCHFTLDNFGIDGLTLLELSELPVDTVKIDGALIRNVATSAVDRSIVAAICQVAGELNISTVAVHVEDRVMVNTLSELGVDYVQGNGLQEPRPLEIWARH